MQVGVLGPVVVDDGGARREIEVPKARALLTVLATEIGRPVAVGSLVDALWGDDPPPTAEKTLQGHISGLRRQLGAEAITTSRAGYALDLPPEDVDVARFEALVVRAADVAEVEPASALDLWDEALGLWRGDPLADLAPGSFRTGLAARLDEMHAGAVLGRIDAELALGHHREVLPTLHQMVRDTPEREDIRGRLMVALYRSDRQVEALETYTELRQLLTERFGLEPSSWLSDLEHQILVHDPALDAAPRTTDNLPAPISSFVGREREVGEVRKLLEEHRLVTLLGPGGIGKSRLALEVARREAPDRDGVRWVDLAGVVDDGAVLRAMARALEVRATPGGQLDEALVAHVRHRSLLVVIDNCEQVTDVAASLVRRILEGGASTSALVTSRRPLGVPGEQHHVVGPLPVPDTTEPEPAGVASVRLFLDRAASRGVEIGSTDELDGVAEICRRVDGLPLAIELLATKTTVSGTRDLAARLEHPSELLSMESDELGSRHGSLASVFDRSIELVGPELVPVLARLAVFPGDFDLDAALAVGCPDLDADEGVDRLARLVDSSLLETDGASGPRRRFRMLVPLREHARERVTSPAERDDASRRHAEHFRELALAAAPHVEASDADRWLEILGREDHNTRAAIEWFLANDRGDDALDFAPALGHELYLRGDFAGCRTLLERLIDASSDPDPPVIALAHLRRAWPTFLAGDAPNGLGACVEAQRLFEAIGDRRGAAESLRAQAHMILLGTGDTDRALPLYDRAISMLDDPVWGRDRAWAEITRAQALLLADRYDAHLDAVLERAEDALTAADDVLGLAHLSMDRVFVAYALDDPRALERAATEEIARSRSSGDAVYEQIALVALGVSAMQLHGDRARAAPLLRRAVDLAWDTGNLLQLGVALQAVGAALVADDPRRGARLWGAATALSPVWPLFLRRYGELIDPVRDDLGVAFDDDVESGRAMSPEQAVALAHAALAGGRGAANQAGT